MVAEALGVVHVIEDDPIVRWSIAALPPTALPCSKIGACAPLRPERFRPATHPFASPPRRRDHDEELDTASAGPDFKGSEDWRA
jgi:hypothetical protein